MPYQVTARRRLVTIAALALLLGACSSTPPQPEADLEVPVYPAKPDTPRFIFERTLRYNSNVETPSRMEQLRRYATGAEQDTKGLVKPFGVAARHGRVYVTDTVQRSVIMFDIQGGSYKEFGSDTPAELSKPTGLAVSSLNELFVTDVSHRRIAVFDLNGKFLRFLGGPQLFQRPTGVAVSPDGMKLYVIDAGGVDSSDHHMYILDTLSGSRLATIGGRGSEPGQFNLPLQAATAPDSTVYVVDKGNFRVSAFNHEGAYLRSFGTIGRYPGQFFSPKGIATDTAGNIYVVDTAFGNVQIFDPQGQLLMVIGQRGQSSRPGNYMLPAGVAVDETGSVYIVDQFFRKVDVYRPLTPAEVAAMDENKKAPQK
jgi:DNA-binding beta-propeller fold protein YncE